MRSDAASFDKWFQICQRTVMPSSSAVMESWSPWMMRSKLQSLFAQRHSVTTQMTGLKDIHSFIHSYSALRLVRQESELSQATSMALPHCILGKILGVGYHYFHPPLDVPTFVARCLHVHNDARGPSSKRWNCGREMLSGNFAKMLTSIPLGIFYMSQIYDMGPMALLPLRRKACWGFFLPLKIRRLQLG
jgi:hypothetical protein